MITDETLAVPAAARKGGAKGKKPRLDREGLVHDLLIKRKTGAAAGPNEPLGAQRRACPLRGVSDVPIAQIRDAKDNKVLKAISKAVLETYRIKPGRRPDIFLFAEEGQCILMELKAADVERHSPQQELRRPARH
jgi:hypothetical protein